MTPSIICDEVFSESAGQEKVAETKAALRRIDWMVVEICIFAGIDGILSMLVEEEEAASYLNVVVIKMSIIHRRQSRTVIVPYVAGKVVAMATRIQPQ